MCNVAEHPSYPEIGRRNDDNNNNDNNNNNNDNDNNNNNNDNDNNNDDMNPTAPPNDQCNGCDGCYYPYHGVCQQGYDAGNCQMLAPYYGTVWCGN
ncbi:hypothetical protein SDRG_14315 [Saprolegnia diclina VS20]|uniref:Uncharacterized protein n=1 Tax=Saprolegnia diclina (strain VS20) TaxID=1156394 RepID=T0PQW8_SAPDV|nr:hypothetical protein SDRG_14315 [Saprolegnia diclina VS20]EQC27894.1 hypothetical protein SDRG_14315 [Saprolegnia diclina VS20]|eukprot:XP_008618659.1 hypothetical protein SDRG_14315 [Saprolegnia diclina VS20]